MTCKFYFNSKIQLKKREVTWISIENSQLIISRLRLGQLMMC